MLRNENAFGIAKPQAIAVCGLVHLGAHVGCAKKVDDLNFFFYEMIEKLRNSPENVRISRKKRENP